MFQIPVENILNNKWGFWEIKNTPPFYIDMLRWWEYEFYVDKLNEKIKKENEANKEQQQQGSSNIPDYSKKMPDVNSMMNKFNKYK